MNRRNDVNMKAYELSFNDEFLKQLNKIVACKKKGAGIERLVRFAVGYLKYCREKGIYFISR
jgi:hypothetical protein